jgi:hypothetical protein
MTFGTIPCSCGGENEKCFRCFGTGMFTPGRNSDRDKVRQRSGHSAGKRAKTAAMSAPTIQAKQWEKCPHCGVVVSKLARHLKKAHHATFDLKPPFTQLLIEDEAKNKPVKQAIRRSSPESRQGVVLVQDATSIRFRCPKCRCTAPNEIQLQSHIVGSHGKEVLNLYLSAKGGAVTLSSPKPAPNAPAPPNLSEPNLDATKGWSGSFRDYGQFGSHPAFDSMDDESSS